ncbi:MAG: hypothetical protein ABSE56_04260 [Bryobacteraceae bacterium]
MESFDHSQVHLAGGLRVLYRVRAAMANQPAFHNIVLKSPTGEQVQVKGHSLSIRPSGARLKVAPTNCGENMLPPDYSDWNFGEGFHYDFGARINQYKRASSASAAALHS